MLLLSEELRMEVRVNVASVEEYEFDFPPEEAEELISWFQEKLYLVPKEYRKGTKIRLSSISSYEDSHYATIEIYYYRPESKEEELDRINADALKRRQKEIQEKHLFETLKAKYECE
jgi:hypothetical protein